MRLNDGDKVVLLVLVERTLVEDEEGDPLDSREEVLLLVEDTRA
jgi:hypothetical protein